MLSLDFSKANLACKVAPHEALAEIELLEIPGHLIIHEASPILS